MRDRLLVAMTLISPLWCVGAYSQSAPVPCRGSAYAQFDFWIGTWSVSNQGKPAGTNRIEKVLNGCALLETWRSTGNHRGHSLTFYDAARDRWHQTWIDVAGQPLYLEGTFSGGTMRLEGTRPPAEAGGKPLLHRIEWTPLPDGRVRQHWRSSTDDGRSWSEVFDGYYEKSVQDVSEEEKNARARTSGAR